MNAISVPKLPQCSECFTNDVEREATMQVLTPMKMRLNLCDEHFDTYVESRLGTGTVARLVAVQAAGGGRRGRE